MCGKKEFFSYLDESVRGEVNFGNKAKVSIMGKGNVLIRLKDGSHEHISDVFYVPSLHWNLLSMGQLSEKGLKIIIDKGVCIIENIKKELVAEKLALALSCPTKSVLDMTPEEAWSSYKPNVEALRVFGCVAYAHIPVEKRKKFDGMLSSVKLKLGIGRM
ncbi:hypothetical protein EZV62_002243 [Acer yangbiense]|uniref:Retrovirus-related Pol polyprotein from transposon TNT 1-94-like beta-barrel domain-containing protein n=1 Tax=Acer yangbiense TaxID=1000413 RepID=A0A5C7IXQ2_9ROSI|nr:hypothetical protein EZV62_002243 [Acer yangbiense]